MKALTIHQPSAAAVIAGHKDVENRSWKVDYRGPLVIHAGRGWDDVAERFYRRWLRRSSGTSLDRSSPHDAVDCPLLRHGVILGTVELIDIVDDSQSPWAMDDMWHWLLANPVPLAKQIPFSGKLGLWNYELEWTAGIGVS